jgi:hypothetical protein
MSHSAQESQKRHLSKIRPHDLGLQHSAGIGQLVQPIGGGLGEAQQQARRLTGAMRWISASRTISAPLGSATMRPASRGIRPARVA